MDFNSRDALLYHCFICGQELTKEERVSRNKNIKKLIRQEYDWICRCILCPDHTFQQCIFCGGFNLLPQIRP